MRPPRSLLVLVPILALLPPLLRAEMRTLTDKQGRTLQADVIAVSGDQVEIRRADGQLFKLPLANLSDADQQALKKWAADQPTKPAPLPPGALDVQMARGMFDVERRKEDATLSDGKVRKDAISISEEKWGYTITINNRSDQTLTDLRADYVLFATVDDPDTRGQKDDMRRKAYRSTIKELPAHGRTEFRTEPVLVVKTQLPGNIRYSGSGTGRTREQLYGIWIKIYRGGELVYEAATPDKLRGEKWPE